MARLRRGRRRVDLHDRTVVIVDDGIATGATARVACTVARHLGAAKVVLAVPVAPAGAADRLPEADELVCVAMPRQFLAVGSFYRDFTPTSDDEVVVLLDDAARRMLEGRAEGDLPDCDVDVEIPVGDLALAGHLHLPEPAAAWSSSRTAAAAAATARATDSSPRCWSAPVWGRCCSTC